MEFAGIVTVAGTVATLGVSEIRFTVRAVGKDTDKFRVSLPGLAAEIVTLGVGKLSEAVEKTVVVVPDDRVAPEAVTVANPKFTPQICGIWPLCGVVFPAVMVTWIGFRFGLKVAIEELLLVSVTKALPGPAGAAKVTGKGAHTPGATDICGLNVAPVTTPEVFVTRLIGFGVVQFSNPKLATRRDARKVKREFATLGTGDGAAVKIA